MTNDAPSFFGGGGGVVEMDETFIGREPGSVKRSAFHHKMKIVALVDRETRSASSIVVDDLGKETLVEIMDENISREARLFTDDAKHYHRIAKRFADHKVVNHTKKEWGRGEVHTNTIESYFSVFKRGMRGVYQHCGKQHLHRSAAEFEFRYNHRAAKDIDDTQRTTAILQCAEGKRLTYRRFNSVVV
jgi:transposase-like protein